MLRRVLLERNRAPAHRGCVGHRTGPMGRGRYREERSLLRVLWDSYSRRGLARPSVLDRGYAECGLPRMRLPRTRVKRGKPRVHR
jgi:hypothetical protein